MRRALLIACAFALFACGSDSKPPKEEPSGNNPPPASTSKLERPNALARPPAGRLPDDLRPPR
jgi:hypothetical protein